MMKPVYVFLLIALAMLFTAGCGNPKRGALSAEARTELEKLVDTPISAERKFYKLAETLTALLNEAMAIENDEAAMAHLREFATNNDLALQALARDIDDWAKVMPDDERMEMILKLMDRDFSTQLRNRVPAFRRRIAYNEAYLREFNQLFGSIEFWR